MQTLTQVGKNRRYRYWKKTHNIFASTEVGIEKEKNSKLRSTLNQALEFYSYNKNSRIYKDTLRAYAMLELLIIFGLTAVALTKLRRKDLNFNNIDQDSTRVLNEYFTVYRFGYKDIIFPMAQKNVVYRTIQRWLEKAELV